MGIQERKEREKEQRRDEILNAAEKVFFEKGLQVATMDDIAGAAELGKSTLYLYCKSKEDLYLAVAMRGSDMMYEMFQKAVSTGEPVLKLIWNLGEAYHEYFNQYRNYFRMYYFFENTEMHSQVSQEMITTCREHDKKIWKLVIDLIQRAIDEGIMRKDLDPLEVAVMLWANSNGLMRVIDRQNDYWKKQMGVDLEGTMRKANALLVKAMLTEKGGKQFESIIV